MLDHEVLLAPDANQMKNRIHFLPLDKAVNQS